MVKDITGHGCVNNKTFKITFPNWMREDLKRHFTRGYFDGDGTICKISGSKNQFVSSICGNDVFIDQLESYLNTGKIYKQDKISILTFSNKSDIEYLRNLYYDNSNIFLKRKYDIFNSFDKDFKRDYSLTKNKKSYIIYDRYGEKHESDNLKLFCKNHDIVYSTMSNLSRGIGKSNKGWICYKKEIEK